MLAEVGVPLLRIISISFILAAIGIMFSTLFQAVGKGFYSMIMSICRQLVVLLPVAFLLSRIGGLDAVWWSFPVAELMSVICSAFFLIRISKRIISKV